MAGQIGCSGNTRLFVDPDSTELSSSDSLRRYRYVPGYGQRSDGDVPRSILLVDLALRGCEVGLDELPVVFPAARIASSANTDDACAAIAENDFDCVLLRPSSLGIDCRQLVQALLEAGAAALVIVIECDDESVALDMLRWGAAGCLMVTAANPRLIN